MKLYFSPGACPLASHIALCEAGIPCELVRVDLATKKLADGRDFRTINPDGYVPVLELDDGSLLTEGPAIMQYIADRAPERRLAPANGSMARYRLQSVLNFISTELHKSFTPLFNPTASSDAKEGARQVLGERLTNLAPRLTGTYLTGDDFTVADAYLFTVLGWSKYVNFDLSPWPAFGSYLGRVAARPAVQQALKEEGLI
jgi:glutathione S-transferase